MGRFALGFVLGVVVGAAAAYLLLGRPAPDADPPPVVTAPQPAPAPKRPRKQATRRPVRASEEAAVITDADLRPSAAGEALRAAATELDLSSDREPRDLTQEEIDGAFARRADDLVRCITDARAGAAVTGRVVAGVVVGADGRVARTRVEAPAWLLGHGLYACARPVLLSLRFPETGKETVVTVPFDISE